MSKNMSKNTNTKSDKITKETITATLDTTALEVARSDEKATQTKKEKLLSLIGGEKKFNAATDSEKRKLLDLCISAINERIGELKTGNKAVAKEERKPLSECLLWQGLRSLLGLASAMRSRLRTKSEKDQAAEKAEKARREHEEKTIQAAIDAGKVISADAVQNVKTCGSAEEIIFSVYAQLTASGITAKEWLRMAKACTLAD